MPLTLPWPGASLYGRSFLSFLQSCVPRKPELLMLCCLRVERLTHARSSTRAICDAQKLHFSSSFSAIAAVSLGSYTYLIL